MVMRPLNCSSFAMKVFVSPSIVDTFHDHAVGSWIVRRSFIFQASTVKCFERTDFTLRLWRPRPHVSAIVEATTIVPTLLFRRRTWLLFIRVSMKNRIFTRLSYGDEIKTGLLVERFVSIVRNDSTTSVLLCRLLFLWSFSSWEWMGVILRLWDKCFEIVFEQILFIFFCINGNVDANFSFIWLLFMVCFNVFKAKS